MLRSSPCVFSRSNLSSCLPFHFCFFTLIYIFLYGFSSILIFFFFKDSFCGFFGILNSAIFFLCHFVVYSVLCWYENSCMAVYGGDCGGWVLQFQFFLLLSSNDS
ncbi:hypothetical protein L6164_031350 [Bauhinia variegata]|uniref:Uncharacterized protein n=1 Tax=Bauhinia variegata TaxID=167791 RepID=A0ACB9LFH4_BAUVA|nr:hypothetical protein L6164_031350 [Bauhinia variegata]